ncbi:hypothetical protein ACHAXN_013307 [Cyclotella atomus]
MGDDRRAVLRKMQQQRKDSLSVTTTTEEYEQQQQQAGFDAKASLVSLRQFNASDFEEEEGYNDDPRYQDDRNRTDTLKLVLYDLNSAIAPREIRLLAIRSAMDEFDHDEELLHDEELDLRADHILLQKLCYAMSIDPRDDEVGYICAALEMVYRAGKKRLAKSFHEICDAILPMFVEMIRRPPCVERIEEAVEEEKEEILVSEVEEFEEEVYGIEPNDQYDPYAPTVHIGDDDDESAESVSIPAGTGEYFDHMQMMTSMGVTGDVVDPEASIQIVPQPVNLGNGGELEPYDPANVPQPHQYLPASTTQPQQQTQQQQGQQYTPEQLYVLAEQISKMQAQQASQQQMVQGQAQGIIPQTHPYHHTPNNNAPPAADAASGQLVPAQPNREASQYAIQLNQYPTNQVPYAEQQMTPMHQGQAMGSQPINNNMAYATQPYSTGTRMSQAPPPTQNSMAHYQPMPQATHSFPGTMTSMQPGQGMPNQPYSVGQAMPPGPVYHPTQLPPSQVDSTAMVPNLSSQEVVAAANQLTNLSVGDATLTDDEALRLRGGGDGDSQDEYSIQDVTGHFDQLYEGANRNFPSAASYNEYVMETEEISLDASGVNHSVNIDPLLDSSEITSDSEQMRNLEARLRASSKSGISNPIFEEFEDGQQGCDGYNHAQGGQQGYEGDQQQHAQPLYDEDGNFADNYSAYLNAQSNDEVHEQSAYDQDQTNFNYDYSEYLNNEAGDFEHPLAENEYGGNGNMDDGSNPFASQNQFGADDESNPFVYTSGRAGELRSEGSKPYPTETFVDSRIPTHVEDTDIPSHIGDDQGSLSASLRSGLTNDFTYDAGSRKIDKKLGTQDYSGTDSNPFEQGDIPYQVDNLNAVEEHPHEDHDFVEGMHGQSPYDGDYESNQYANGGQSQPGQPHYDEGYGYNDINGGQPQYDEGYENDDMNGGEPHYDNRYGIFDEDGGQQHYDEGHVSDDKNGAPAHYDEVYGNDDMAETSESSQSNGVYTVPTFNPEDRMYPRRDSELTSDSQFDESRFDESRTGPTLHVVEEENDEQHDEMEHDDQQHNEYDDDIFQFQEPGARPMPSKSYTTRYIEKEIFCPLAVRKVLKILRYFSRVLSAMEHLAQQPGLVDALLYQMTRNPYTSDDEDEIAARVDAIACVVNLACAEENKIMLVYHPGLLDAVVNIANHDPIEEAREHAAIVMMNLAYAEENKVHMVNQDNLLDTLVYLLSDESPFTRRYASAALFTLACTYANTAVMARHCDGGILEALRKVLLNDPVDEARINAAEALFNMARNNSDETVESMGNHPKLLASLAHSVLTDYSADVRAYAARALEWLSADIHFPMPCHPRLLQALTTASQWTKTTCIAEALKMQASLVENRRSMVEHPGLLDALAQMSLLDGINDDEVKTCAISALERLSKEPSTRHLMAGNEGVMTALTRATFEDDAYNDEEDVQNSTLMKTALKNLAGHL